MNYLLALLKIEKNRLDWFLDRLSALNVKINRDTSLNLSKIEDFLKHGCSDDQCVSAIRDIRTTYLILIERLKDRARDLNDELEGRHLEIQDMIGPVEFRDVAKELFDIQRKASVEVTSPWKDPKYIHRLLASVSGASDISEPGYESLYDKNVESCLSEVFRLAIDMENQYQMTDVWSKSQLEYYLSQIDLNMVSNLIEYVEDLDKARYELFCDQYDDIKDLPHADLVRENLNILGKEIIGFLREKNQIQSKKIYELMMGLTDASTVYRELESLSQLGPSFECIDIDGQVKEDFQKPPIEKIKELMSAFARHMRVANRYYSGEHNLFPDSEMIAVVMFSRDNCLRYVEAYEALQESRVGDLGNVLKYSLASREFKLDMENALLLSEKLSPWKRVPVPLVAVATNSASMFAQVFDAIDELVATSSNAPK